MHPQLVKVETLPKKSTTFRQRLYAKTFRSENQRSDAAQINRVFRGIVVYDDSGLCWQCDYFLDRLESRHSGDCGLVGDGMDLQALGASRDRQHRSALDGCLALKN